MPIDNQWYDELGDVWWDPAGPVATLHDMNPARFGYFKAVLGELKGLKILEVGCGGGILTERFAREGSVITGLDLSRSSLVVATRHAHKGGVDIEYVQAGAESLPFSDSSFDVVVSSDFLEHVKELDRVIGECARVLKPAGLFLYDTINRTMRSRLIVVWLFERVFRVIPRNTHDARMFIKPAELGHAMERHGILNLETRGLSPRSGMLGALGGLIKSRRVGGFKVSADLSVSYLGHGRKIN